MAIVIIIFLLLVIIVLLGGGRFMGPLFGFLIVVPLVLLFQVYLWSVSPILAVLPVGLIVGVVIFGFRGEIRRWWNAPEKKKKLPYRNPRALLAEAEEVAEGIYRHPDGRYVARGPRGGLKTYMTLEGAKDYRNS